MRWGVHNYNSDYDFVSLAEHIFDTGDLAMLGAGESTNMRLFQPREDQATRYHQRFYSEFERQMGPVYREFVADFVPAILGTKEICYQTVPTFRIHLPGNVAVGEFHRDRDYNHQDGEVNFWLPLTRAWDTNTLWVETAPGREGYRPVELTPGQILVFDGINLRHGNKPNTTGATRVSFDFRCIPLHAYRDHGARSVSAGRQLSIGDYFSLLQ